MVLTAFLPVDSRIGTTGEWFAGVGGLLVETIRTVCELMGDSPPDFD